MYTPGILDDCISPPSQALLYITERQTDCRDYYTKRQGAPSVLGRHTHSQFSGISKEVLNCQSTSSLIKMHWNRNPFIQQHPCYKESRLNTTWLSFSRLFRNRAASLYRVFGDVLLNSIRLTTNSDATSAAQEQLLEWKRICCSPLRYKEMTERNPSHGGRKGGIKAVCRSCSYH